MNPSILHGTEFLSIENHEEIHSWFDSFCKTIPFQVSRARLVRHVHEDKESILITCRTSLRQEVDALVQALDSTDETVINRAIVLLQKSFDRLIKKANLPSMTQIAGHEIALTWVPEELSLFERDLRSPQQQSISELNLRTMVCLETINIVMDSERVFTEKWSRSNDPFLSAGLLATGDWVWMDEFEKETVSNPISQALLLERIGQNPGRYIMLLRLAQLAGYEGHLLQSWIQIKQFANRVWLNGINWPYWTDMILEADSLSLDEMALPVDVYMRLDQEVDMVGDLLMAALKGHEQKIPQMIDEGLSYVQVPQPALFRPWRE